MNPPLPAPASSPAFLAYVFDPTKDIIAAPRDPALWPVFREQLAQWRTQARAALAYDDTLYGKPEFAWASSSYACYFLMMYDELFFDAKTGRYTVDAILEEGDREFDGYDSVVLWHAYPRIGVDQRNQFDFYRDMPGGLAGVREVVDAFHRRGLRVYIDYNPWDQWTRREAKSDADMLAELVRDLDVDGIFLDTMTRGEGFRGQLDAARPGVVLEGEGTPPLECLADHHASWAQWFDDSEAPGVLRHKWFERRHMQHQTQRRNSDHTAELHTAWMNGSGMMIWENVFGAWVPWHARDRSLLRAMLPIQRRYTALFSGEGWTPLVPVAQPGVYASLWSSPGGDTRLWTLVNRAEQPVEGTLLEVAAEPGLRVFDLIAGIELHAGALAGHMPARGLGCFIVLPAARVDADFAAFLKTQAATHARADHDTTRPYRAPSRQPALPERACAALPPGMVEVKNNPWVKQLYIQMRARECGFYDPNVSDEAGFRDSYFYQTQSFARPFVFRPYAIDETPVTNAQFAQFLAATGYHPEYPQHFLRHWSDARPPAGKADHPVVWVDLIDARAYAKWAGKRLPTEDEWQYAAQGGGGREYPWGNGLRPGVCNLGETGDTTPVKAFPDGRSAAFPAYDYCGNVWQWTEGVHTEGRTRFCLIRGGSHFVPGPDASLWYTDAGVRPASFSSKFLLLWPGLDRCATIGFRCVVDLHT